MVKKDRNFSEDYEKLMRYGDGFLNGRWINLKSSYKREKSLTKINRINKFFETGYGEVNSKVEKKVKYLNNVLDNIKDEIDGLNRLHKTYHSKNTPPNIREHWGEIEYDVFKRHIQLDFYIRQLLEEMDSCIRDLK